MSNPDDETPLDPASRAHRREGALADADLRRDHHGRRSPPCSASSAIAFSRAREARRAGRGHRDLLPKGARIVATAVAEDRIVVTVEVGGALEIRTFDLRTLKPTGRLQFATEP